MEETLGPEYALLHGIFLVLLDGLSLTSPSFTAKLNNVDVASSNLQYGTFNTNLASSGCYVETGQQQQQHHLFQQKGHFGTRSESSMADNSQQTDDKTHCNNRAGNGELVVVDSNDQTKLKHEDQKTLHRLAQNCEAARKIRLRKKAYVQQLENSRVRLAQLEVYLLQLELWGILLAQLSEMLKTIGAKADVFHILFGTWKTPAERCFMWLGGFRSSELLKAYVQQLESSRLKLTQLELRLEEKISNSESENQVHRQQALAVSPTRKALTTRLIPEALLLLQQLTHNLIILLTLLFQFM